MTKKAAAAHTCWFLLVLGAYFAGTSTRPPSVDTAGTPARDIAVAISTPDLPDFLGKPVNAAETRLHGKPLAEALAGTFGEPNRQHRLLSFMQLLEQIKAEDFPEVIKIFKQTDAEGRWFTDEWKAFWRKWGELDPDAALDPSNGTPGSDDIMKEVVRAAILDRGGAEARRLLKLPALQGLSTLADAVAEALAAKNPKDAMDLISELGSIEAQQQGVAGLLKGAAEKGGLKAAISSMESLEKKGLNPSAMLAGLTQLMRLGAGVSGDAAADVVVQFRDKGYLSPVMVESVVAFTLHNLSKYDPETALNLIARLDQDFMGRQLPVIVRELAKTFPVQTETWLKLNAGKPKSDQIKQWAAPPKPK